MPIAAVEEAIAEVEANRQECLGLLASIKQFHQPPADEPYHPTFRLIATPMLYSAWERCFTLCHEIGLRLVRDMAENPMTLSASLRAVWLMRMPFYRSLVDRMKNQVGGEEQNRTKRGHFVSLCDFLTELDEWSQQGLDRTLATSDLVMTFSNVNPEVVGLNARAIGLEQTNGFAALRLGKLHDLIGRRNEIGHGAVIVPPSNENFLELWQFTETLLTEYSSVMTAWIREQFDSGVTVTPTATGNG
jgi:MAE_28990/MAE_18760-like HEPN